MPESRLKAWSPAVGPIKRMQRAVGDGDIMPCTLDATKNLTIEPRKHGASTCEVGPQIPAAAALDAARRHRGVFDHLLRMARSAARRRRPGQSAKTR